jgi:uncharacterized protein YndB with AHSA1/START domain
MNGQLGSGQESVKYLVERELVIAAPREVVFRYFTDSERWASWWGAGSTIEPREGAPYVIRYPNGATASGAVLEIAPPERLVLSFGYDDPSKPIAPGGSQVVITLAEHPRGTLLSLRHHVDTEAIREMHVPGWRYQLAVFAKVVTTAHFAGANEKIDAYYRAWSVTDANERRRLLESCASEEITFADGFGCTQGLDDLLGHIAACAVHFPGVILQAAAPPRMTHATAISDWEALSGANVVMKGSNVFEFAPAGRISRVVGIAGA